MREFTFFEALRLTNAFLASFVVFTLAYRGRKFWEEYDSARKAAYVGFGLYALATAEFSFEAFASKLPIGAWSFFFFAANIVTIVALKRYGLLFGPSKRRRQNLTVHE